MDVVEFTLVFSFLWSVLCLIETILQTQFLSVYSDESNWQMFSTLTLPAHMWINFSIKHVIIGNCYGLVYNLFSVIILNDCLSRVIFFVPSLVCQYNCPIFPFPISTKQYVAFEWNTYILCCNWMFCLPSWYNYCCKLAAGSACRLESNLVTVSLLELTVMLTLINTRNEIAFWQVHKRAAMA